jgi:hypothetical protein
MRSCTFFAEFGHASVTHHLMQTLEFLIQYDPKTCSRSASLRLCLSRLTAISRT